MGVRVCSDGVCSDGVALRGFEGQGDSGEEGDSSADLTVEDDESRWCWFEDRFLFCSRI